MREELNRIFVLHGNGRGMILNRCLFLFLAVFMLVNNVQAGQGDDKENGKMIKMMNQTLLHDGLERTYHIYVPTGFSHERLWPLVLVLHGGGGRGDTFDQDLTDGKLSLEANKRETVLVFPEAVDKQWCDGRTEILTGESHDDVGFVAELIDHLVANHFIDPKQVFVTGISNGGFMAIRLAMDLSHKIAAVAPVTAQISEAIQLKRPKQPIAIMVLNGTEDPLVPYGGGHVRVLPFSASRGKILSTTETIERFRKYNGCDPVPKTFTLEDRYPGDGTVVEISRYFRCRQKKEVALVKIVGGGHTWPNGNQYLHESLVGKVTREVDASQMIIDFFLEYSSRTPILLLQPPVKEH